MALPDPLPAPARQAVADQLGQFLTLPKADLAAALGPVRQPALAESLAVCFLTAQQVLNPPTDLRPLAVPSGAWHHQVHTAAGTTHLARSSQQGLAVTNLQVDQWVESPLAAKVEEAMAWVDQAAPDDGVTVRLLVIPAYYVHALLLVRGARLAAVLVDQPAEFTRLEYRKEYPLRDFLKRLARESVGGTLT